MKPQTSRVSGDLTQRFREITKWREQGWEMASQLLADAGEAEAEGAYHRSRLFGDLFGMLTAPIIDLQRAPDGVST